MVTIRSEDDDGTAGAGAGFGAAGTATGTASGAGTSGDADGVVVSFRAAAVAAASAFLAASAFFFAAAALAISSVLAFLAAAAASLAFSAAARWEVPTSPDALPGPVLALASTAPADAEDCADEFCVPVAAPHADVASRTESRPADSRLFLRMENKASSCECGKGQTRRGMSCPELVTVCGTQGAPAWGLITRNSVQDAPFGRV